LPAISFILLYKSPYPRKNLHATDHYINILFFKKHKIYNENMLDVFKTYCPLLGEKQTPLKKGEPIFTNPKCPFIEEKRHEQLSPSRPHRTLQIT